MGCVRISPVAEAQLEEIYRYSEARWGEQQADAYLSGALALMERLASREIVWRPVAARLDVGGYVHRYDKHFIYWREFDDGAIGIVAVLHERMHQNERVKQAFLDQG